MIDFITLSNLSRDKKFVLFSNVTLECHCVVSLLELYYIALKTASSVLHCANFTNYYLYPAMMLGNDYIN